MTAADAALQEMSEIISGLSVRCALNKATITQRDELIAELNKRIETFEAKTGEKE